MRHVRRRSFRGRRRFFRKVTRLQGFRRRSSARSRGMGRSAMGRFRSRVQRLDQRGSTTFGTSVLAVTSTAILFQIGTAGQSVQQNHRKGSYTVPTGLLLKWQWLETDGSNNTRLIVMSPKMQTVSNPIVNAWQNWAGNEHFLRNPIGLMEVPEHKYLRIHLDKHEAIQAPSIRGDSFVYHNCKGSFCPASTAIMNIVRRRRVHFRNLVLRQLS